MCGSSVLCQYCISLNSVYKTGGIYFEMTILIACITSVPSHLRWSLKFQIFQLTYYSEFIFKMQFSNFLAFLALASIGVQASPTINSRPNALEKRAAREETNYEVAIEHGLPKDAKEKTLYAFEMVSPVKTTPPEDVHVDLNRLTTNKGGSHSRLVVGYKSGEKVISNETPTQIFAEVCLGIFSGLL